MSASSSSKIRRSFASRSRTFSLSNARPIPSRPGSRFDDLLKSALRWRPDRIILGEVRGIEARTLLDSFNTGHAGSLATIHANSAEKALHRFANLVMRSHTQTTFVDTEAEIGDSVDFVVHIERQPGGRVIREVLRMIGYDRDTKRFLIEPVFEEAKLDLVVAFYASTLTKKALDI